MAGDDGSNSSSLDTSDSQSDASVGSRLVVWAEPVISPTPAEPAPLRHRPQPGPAPAPQDPPTPHAALLPASRGQQRVWRAVWRLHTQALPAACPVCGGLKVHPPHTPVPTLLLKNSRFSAVCFFLGESLKCFECYSFFQFDIWDNLFGGVVSETDFLGVWAVFPSVAITVKVTQS